MQNACHARQIAAFGIEMGSARGDEGGGGAGNDVALAIPAAAYGNEIDQSHRAEGKCCRNGKAQQTADDIGNQSFEAALPVPWAILSETIIPCRPPERNLAAEL